jgi:hypothetical protein
VGLNYLDACRARPDDPGATTAENGIRGVLRGDLPFFELEYPCHGPGRHRWYRMVVSPLSTGGAVVQHFDITSRVVKEDQLRHWIAAVRALDVPGLQERLPAEPRP